MAERCSQLDGSLQSPRGTVIGLSASIVATEIPFSLTVYQVREISSYQSLELFVMHKFDPFANCIHFISKHLEKKKTSLLQK